MNLLVTSSLGSEGGSVAVPRVLCAQQGGAAATGISSFAFQGTNAHAVIGASAKCARHTVGRLSTGLNRSNPASEEPKENAAIYFGNMAR